MDRSWMTKNRLSLEYREGVEHFLNFAQDGATDCDSVRCPCTKCVNLFKISLRDIKEHLFRHGIDPNYVTWKWHGEDDYIEASPSSSTHEPLVEDQDGGTRDDFASTIEMVQAANEEFEGDADKFQKLLEDADKPLYKGCEKYTKLSAIVKLFNIKAKSGWSDKSFSELLTLFADMLPKDNELPSSFSQAKRSIFAFGIEYQKIHACPNDCILYRNEYKDANTCPTCERPRYKVKKNTANQGNEDAKKGVPAKVLWYFPPIPRFQRWFRSLQTAKDLRWHANEREIDGQLRHPADSPTWKLVDDKWPHFGLESRNLRLALSANGINPYNSLSTRYSCWPVILNTYNLPPWLYMKRKFMMLTLLIPGPKQPANNIDVYLAPLIDDLKKLWDDGVETYDAYQKDYFTLRAILLWTINDFPAYGNLSGCVVKGYYACPICSEETYSQRLRNCHKCIYTGHRRYLPPNHPYRNQRKAFNGEPEFGLNPKPLNSEQILLKVSTLKVSWGKKDKKSYSKKPITKSKRKRNSGNQNPKVIPRDVASNDDVRCAWNKKSIFFELEYWMHLPIRHNLDVMHIEKNVCDSIIGTLLNIAGKTKDGVHSRMDLVEMGLRKELAPQVNDRGTYLPPACYTLSRNEKKMVCETLYELKVPNGYSSNFRSHVSMEDLKLYGLKSHDCHMLMQQILPIAI